MNWLRIVALVLLSSTSASAQSSGGPMPFWIVRGFEAALSDPLAAGPAGLFLSGVHHLSLADDRTDAVIDKLLPLLGDLDSHVREAAAQNLRQIATDDRTGAVIARVAPSAKYSMPEPRLLARHELLLLLKTEFLGAGDFAFQFAR